MSGRCVAGVGRGCAVSSFEKLVHQHAELQRAVIAHYEDETRDLFLNRLTATSLDDEFMALCRELATELQVPVSTAYKMLLPIPRRMRGVT